MAAVPHRNSLVAAATPCWGSNCESCSRRSSSTRCGGHCCQCHRIGNGGRCSRNCWSGRRSRGAFLGRVLSEKRAGHLCQLLDAVGDVPTDELVDILTQKCSLPKSRAVLMVKTMENLQIYRSQGSLFSGKDSTITVRDLLKWGARVNKDE